MLGPRRECLHHERRVYACLVALADELRAVADTATRYAGLDEEPVAVVPAGPGQGERLYLCAFRGEAGQTSWLALDAAARPVNDKVLLRDAVSIVAMCELAEETAAGGDLDDLRSQLVALRLTENPPGIDEAEEAVLALQAVIDAPPRVATPAYLDDVGLATRRLEQALGDATVSPFAEAMKQSMHTVEALARDIEANYKGELS